MLARQRAALRVFQAERAVCERDGTGPSTAISPKRARSSQSVSLYPRSLDIPHPFRSAPGCLNFDAQALIRLAV